MPKKDSNTDYGSDHESVPTPGSGPEPDILKKAKKVKVCLLNKIIPT